MHSRGIGASGAISKATPDLVILDMDRSFIDGGTLCELLRKDPRVSAVPVLLLSSVLPEAAVQIKAIESRAQGGIS